MFWVSFCLSGVSRALRLGQFTELKFTTNLGKSFRLGRQRIGNRVSCMWLFVVGHDIYPYRHLLSTASGSYNSCFTALSRAFCQFHRWTLKAGDLCGVCAGLLPSASWLEWAYAVSFAFVVITCRSWSGIVWMNFFLITCSWWHVPNPAALVVSFFLSIKKQ